MAAQLAMSNVELTLYLPSLGRILIVSFRGHVREEEDLNGFYVPG